MEHDLERSLKVKTLENSKLRQRLKELEEMSTLHTSTQEKLLLITKENDQLKHTMQKCVQNENDLRNQIKRLQENNQKLMEEIRENGKSKYRTEAEAVNASEENFHLTYSLQNLQEKNEKCRAELTEVLMENHKKEQAVKYFTEELAKTKQQNKNLEVDCMKLSVGFEEANRQLQMKDLQITQMEINLEKNCENRKEYKTLRDTVHKLQNEKLKLQEQIRDANDKNTSNMIKLLQKNKNLLEENKKFKTDSEKLKRDFNDEKVKELQCNIQVSNQQVFELKNVITKLEDDLQKANSVVKDREEIFNQKCQFQSEFQNMQAEVVQLNQGHLILLNENCKLKKRIESLEWGNFEKLKVIAKLAQSHKS